jgi:hypothetical protein
MKKNTSVVFRSVESVNNRIDYLKRKGIKFKVYSSQYSTVIESNGQKIRYVTQVYDNRVFMCSKMLQNHLRDSDIEYIQSATWNTKNYDSFISCTKLRHPIIERIIHYEYIPHDITLGLDIKGLSAVTI